MPIPSRESFQPGKIRIEYKKGGHIAHNEKIPHQLDYSVVFQGDAWKTLDTEQQAALFSRQDVQAIASRIQWLHGKKAQEIHVDEITARDTKDQPYAFYAFIPDVQTGSERYILPKTLNSDMQKAIEGIGERLERESFVAVTPWQELQEKGHVHPRGEAATMGFSKQRTQKDLETIPRYITLNDLADLFPPQTFVQLNPYHVIYRESTKQEKHVASTVESLLPEKIDIATYVRDLYPDNNSLRQKIQRRINNLTVFIHFRPPDQPEGGSVWVIGGMGHEGPEITSREIRGDRFKDLPFIERTAVEEGTEELLVEKSTRRGRQAIPFYSPRHDNKKLGTVSSSEHGQTTATHIGIPRALWLPTDQSVLLDKQAEEGKTSAMIPYKLLIAWKQGVFELRGDIMDQKREVAWRQFITFLSTQCGVPEEDLGKFPRTIHVPPMSIIDEPESLKAAYQLSRPLRRLGALKDTVLRRYPTVPDKLLIQEG